MASRQSDELAVLFRASRERYADPSAGLDTIRDVCDAMAERAGKEPEGVTYAEVDAGGVPALWCIPAGCDDGSVLIFSHAGGTVAFSMYSDRKAAGHLAEAAGIRAMVLDFRRSPEHRFPAQQEDVEAAYRWLLGQGYQPNRIALGGHSVGGNFAVSVAITLRDQGAPLPGAILSVSAWYDIELKNPALRANAETDAVLSLPLLEAFRDSWLGGTGTAYDDPRVNLMYADLTGLPPVNIYYGAHEVFAGELQELAELAWAAGLDTSLHAVPAGQHRFLLGAGRVPETDAAITAMGTWLRAKLGGA